VIRAKGRVAVAACMKEGGKRLIWDEATVFMRKCCTHYWLDVCGSLNYDVITK